MKHKARSKVRIRPMELDDLSQVYHLGEKLFTSSEVPNLYRTWDEFEVLAYYQDGPELCMVAVAGKKVVGFALATTIEKPRSSWKYGHLVWLGVAPKYQRSGIARRLFRSFRSVMLENSVRMLMVDTAAENEGALAFFRELGFGRPQKHIYLTAKLSQNGQADKRAKKT